jgi:cell division protein FtsX
MSVDFYSKEDAFQILEERLPNVIETFEKYGIENPLPPTMYVQFRNEKDYVFLKEIVLEYEDVIKNLDDLENNGFAFSDQERRSANVINLTNVITQFGYFLVAVIVMIIIAFLLFGLHLTFYRFREQVEVEKLLGSGYFTIQKPFLLITASVLV